MNPQALQEKKRRVFIGHWYHSHNKSLPTTCYVCLFYCVCRCLFELGTLRFNDAAAKRMSLKKRIWFLSVIIAIIPTHLLCRL